MSRTFKAAVAALMLAVSFAGSVAAGPFEDAKSRGRSGGTRRLIKAIVAIFVFGCAFVVLLANGFIAAIAVYLGIPVWLAIVIFAILTLIYFLPALNASSRGHHNATAIFILNLFLGSSGLFWIIALVWSFTAVQGKFVNPYSIDHREYDVPLRDVTYTDTPLMAETQRGNGDFWLAGISATFLIVLIAAPFVWTAFTGDGAAPAKPSAPFTLGPGERIEPVPEARFYPVNKHVPLPRPRPMN